MNTSNNTIIETTEAHAGPVVKVARNLTEIGRLALALHDQAVNNASDKLMPGGLAMVALADVASLEQWAETLEAAEWRALAAEEDLPEIEDDDDWEPPLQILVFWSERWRTDRGYPIHERPTFDSEAGFIRNSLDWAWDNEVKFDDFAKDIHKARITLENILTAGTRVERTRVMCDRDNCETRLIKIYSPRVKDSLVCPDCSETYQLDSATDCTCGARLEVVWYSDRANDHHKCPRCKAKFDADDFRKAHAKQLRSTGAEKFVTLTDAIGTLKVQGRAERTVRKWLEDPEHLADICLECANRYPAQEYAACLDCDGELAALNESTHQVTSYREPSTNVVHVWWPDLWRLHLVTATRKRRVA